MAAITSCVYVLPGVQGTIWVKMEVFLLRFLGRCSELFLLYFFLWEESCCFTFHCIRYISQQEGRNSSIMLYVDSEIISDQ